MSRASPWLDVLIGVAPFLVWGAYLILHEIPLEWPLAQSLDALRRGLFWAVLLLPALGLGVGWVSRFPRWSYACAGLALLFGLYLWNAATPGLRFLSVETFGRELWGPRAFGPAGLALLAGLLITRSGQPARQFFASLRADPSLITFALFGGMPLLIFIGFDEVDRAFSLPFMIGLPAAMALTVAAYLHGATRRQRALALTIGVVVIVGVTVIAPAAFWLPRDGVNLPLTAIWGAGIAGLLLAPTLAALRGRSAPLSPAA